MIEKIDKKSSLFIMMDSGARGDIGQITQLAGMKGNVVNASGRTIELPSDPITKKDFLLWSTSCRLMEPERVCQIRLSRPLILDI
jgi:DNA-directed RNA polymerase beta' subunit